MICSILSLGSNSDVCVEYVPHARLAEKFGFMCYSYTFIIIIETAVYFKSVKNKLMMIGVSK